MTPDAYRKSKYSTCAQSASVLQESQISSDEEWSSSSIMEVIQKEVFTTQESSQGIRLQGQMVQIRLYKEPKCNQQRIGKIGNTQTPLRWERTDMTLDLSQPSVWDRRDHRARVVCVESSMVADWGPETCCFFLLFLMNYLRWLALWRGNVAGNVWHLAHSWM